ncbi:DNA topoisomerase I [Fasciola hepatica]|uniref:DNA topoisomerase I n=1 Tax=Fasciola hepatica TaxID=6192 RepID=A0A2H1BU51_FASHE|nr:DNA topoisomerase I [Fasciola hepatica]
MTLAQKLKQSRVRYSPSDEEDDVPLSTKLKRLSKKPKPELPDRDQSNDTKSHGDIRKSKLEKPKVKKEPATPTKHLMQSRRSRQKEGNKNRKYGDGGMKIKKDDDRKWAFLEHKGPVFAPPY